MIAEAILATVLAAAGSTHENDSNAIDLPGSITAPQDTGNPPNGNGSIATSSIQNLFGTSTSTATTATTQSQAPAPPPQTTGPAAAVEPAVQSTLTTAATQAGGSVIADISQGSVVAPSSVAAPLVAALTQSGAVTVSSVPESTPATLGYSALVTRITADGVRNVLGAFGIKEIAVESWVQSDQSVRSLTSHRTLPSSQPIAYSTDDLALIASSLSLADTHFVSAEVSGSHLRVEYKTSGRVAGFFPIIMPITIEVSAGAIAASERIKVTYPWYRSVTWVTVPESAMRTAIDQKLLEALQSAVGGADKEARLFVAVMTALADVHQRYERGIKLIL